MSDTINNWFNKYKPTKINDIIGNTDEISNIIRWLNSYEQNQKKFWEEREEKNNKKNKKNKKKPIQKLKKNEINQEETIENEDEIFENFEKDETSEKKKSGKTKNSCMIVTGNHGTGKSCIINAIINEMGYNVEKVNMCNLASSKNIVEKVNKLVRGTNIFDSFHADEINSKKIIIVDELETSSTQTEKKFIENLFKVNDENWYLPIIFISSLKHSKLISIIKANSINIEITRPTIENLKLFSSNIIKKEKILFVPSDRQIIGETLIKYSQFDYRRLMYILYDIHKTYIKNISINNINEYMEYTKQKDTDIEIKKCTAELMLNYRDINECTRIYNGEKVLIPLMIQQNYPAFITKCNNPNNIDLACDISESISMGDIIENYIYSEQNWDMQPVHCHHSCINPSYKLSNLKIKTDADKLKYELQFPNDLNRTSIKNINKRNVVNANAYLRNMDINDFMYANTLTKNLIDDKQIKECAEIYSGYGAKAETIISVLKINKIDVEKTSVPNNIKKLFNKYLDK
jgi:replication factor C subunit 1